MKKIASVCGNIGSSRVCRVQSGSSLCSFLSFMIPFVIVLLSACGRAPGGARVEIVRGEATVMRDGSTLSVKRGMNLIEQDILETSPNGVVVLRLSDGSARFEVQQNSELDLAGMSSGDGLFRIQKGNVWTLVRKVAKGRSFTMETPTAVIGVRGTKFYVSRVGDMDVVCHCEGDVETTSQSGEVTKDQADTLSFTKDGRTIVVTAADLRGMGFRHDHSAIPGSPLGKRSKPNPEVERKIAEIVAKKFAEK